VICGPVTREFLNRRQLHALRPIFDQLLAGPARRENPSAQFSELLFRNVDAEGADCGMGSHGGLLLNKAFWDGFNHVLNREIHEAIPKFVI
jgi:hypothetical protein